MVGLGVLFSGVYGKFSIFCLIQHILMVSVLFSAACMSISMLWPSMGMLNVFRWFPQPSGLSGGILAL